MAKVIFILILLPSMLVTGLLAVPEVVQAIHLDRLSTSDINYESSDAAPTIADRIVRMADEPNPDIANDTAAQSTQKTGFDYPDFGSTAGLNLVGNAAKFNDRLRLTLALNDQAGAAWYTTTQFIQEGFETTFQFQITNTAGGGADGFAFVIQNNSTLILGSSGAGIGYDGITNSLAVEFDTWNDGALGDPSDNHVSVQTRGTVPNSADHTYSLGSTTVITDISNGSVHTVTLQYVTGTMWIFLDDLTTSVLTVSVDLATVLNLDDGQAWVGFTGGTGGVWENHDILNWSFYYGASPPVEQSVALSGPTTGTVNAAYTFTATTSPVTATLPITYCWQATGQDNIVTTTNVLSYTATFTWSTAGAKVITVTATNAGGTADDTHNIIIKQYIYLPMVMKNRSQVYAVKV